MILLLGGLRIRSMRERAAKNEQEERAKIEHAQALTKLRRDAKDGRVEEVASLIGKVKPSEPQAQAALVGAVHGGHLPVLKLLLAHGWILSGNELRVAASYAHLDIMKYLIAKGVDVDAGKGQEYTALHFAAMRKNTEVVKTLLDAGANVDVPAEAHGLTERANDFDRTALMIAAHKGRAEVARLLPKRHANVQYKSARGEIALSVAKQSSHPKIVALLQAAGAKE